MTEAELLDELDGYTASTVGGESVLDCVRRAVATDPDTILIALGLAAGGDLYRGDGQGGGYFTRAFYLPR